MIQETQSGKSDDPATRLLSLITGSWVSQACHVAAELGIADLLADGPQNATELAAASNTHEASLLRLLRALAAIDICRERDDGSFEITPLGALLGTDTPGSLRSWAIWWGAHLWPVWGNLLYSVRTGKSARAMLTGTKGFEHLERDPQAAKTFNTALVELTRFACAGIVRALDYSRFGRVMDVGGGFGELLVALLQAYPAMKGILFDRAQAIEGGRQHLETSGLADRCEFIAGDFFVSVPPGADAYLLKSVIHDWDDHDAQRILENCRQAMTGNARLLLVEQVIPDRLHVSATHQSLARSDLTMLVAHAARERTEADFRRLLKAAGFKVVAVFPAGPTFSVIEAMLAKEQRPIHDLP